MFILILKRSIQALLLVCLLQAIPARACIPQFSKGQATNLVIDIGKLVVPVNAPVGSSIYSKTFAWSKISDSGEQWITCNDDNPNTHQFDFHSQMSGALYIPEVYRTNLDGLGVRVSLRARREYDGFPVIATASPFNQTVHWQSANSNNADEPFHMGMLLLKVEVVKMAPSVQSGQVDYSGDDFLYAGKLRVANIQIKGTVTVGACTVNSATPTVVTLPGTNLSNFGHIGQTAGETSFALTLDCNSSVGVKLQLDGTEAPAARGQGVLINDARKDRAHGIGIQVLYHHTPFRLNQQMDIGTATEGRYTIPLNVRYYQTRQHVSAGRVSAVATWTVDYY